MDNREKVIKELENIDSDMQEEIDEWRDYSDSELSHGLTCDCEWWYNTAQKLKDAIALLKAQEPRVMTLDEAKSAFVIEYRSGKLKEVGMTILDLDVDPANAHYGVLYRVWTSRPTDEQREATPWEK